MSLLYKHEDPSSDPLLGMAVYFYNHSTGQAEVSRDRQVPEVLWPASVAGTGSVKDLISKKDNNVESGRRHLSSICACTDTHTHIYVCIFAYTTHTNRHHH